MEEVTRLGYNFYLQTVLPEDLNKLLSRFEFLYSLRRDEWTKYTLSCNFRMRTAKNGILPINHQLTPLRVSPDGHLWLAVCAVSIPSAVEEYDAYITCADSPCRYALKSNHRGWVELDTISLKEEERKIILLASQGYTTEEMAREMFKSINTVKKYRKSLFEKLGTDKISGAIAYATLHKLL